MAYTGEHTRTSLFSDNLMQITITPVESFRWIDYAKLRGFVFSKDGVALHGMITLPVGSELESFDNEWVRYSSSNATVVYGTEVDSKNNRVMLRTEWGPFSDLAKEDAREALVQFLLSEQSA